MRHAPLVLVSLLLLGILALAIPDPGSDFRAEDFIAYEYYGRATLLEVWSRPHLDAELVSFWRPLSDSLTWVLVRAVGPAAGVVHGLLVGLHLLAAILTMAVARRLLGSSFWTAAVAGLLVAAHPFLSCVVLYMDGGAGQLLFGVTCLLALLALARWREDRLSTTSLALVTVLPMLAFDGGLVFPIVLWTVAFVLPRVRRRAPHGVLLLVPLLMLIRGQILGTLVGSYPLVLSKAVLAAIPGNLLAVGESLVLPVFGTLEADLHAAYWEGLAPLLLGGLLFAAILARLVGRRPSPTSATAGEVWRPFAATVLLALGLIVPCVSDILQHTGPGELPLVVHAYRLYAAILAASLLLACCFAAGERLLPAGSLALAAPWLVLLVVLGAPLRIGHEEAGVQSLALRQQLVEQIRSGDQADGVLVFDVPLTVKIGARPVARLFQYGLSAALRPPFEEQVFQVLPVFSRVDGMDNTAHPATLAAVAADPRLRALRCTESQVVAASLASQFPAPTLVISAPDRGHPAVVPIDSEGSFELQVAGISQGELRLILLNPVHPYFVQDMPSVGLRLVKEGPSGSAPGRLRARARHALEIARRCPQATTWVILETRAPVGQEGDFTPGLSNVLAIRLQETTGTPED